MTVPTGLGPLLDYFYPDDHALSVGFGRGKHVGDGACGCDSGADVLDCRAEKDARDPVGRDGYRVIASDGRPSAGRGQATGQGREWPRWVNADYRQLPFRMTAFDVVINLSRASVLTGDACRSGRVRGSVRVLRPGGHLCLRQCTGSLMSEFRGEEWYGAAEGALLLDRGHFDHSGDGRSNANIDRSGGERVTDRFRLRISQRPR